MKLTDCKAPRVVIVAARPELSTERAASVCAFKVHCCTCSLREACIPVGLDVDEVWQLDAILSGQRRLKKGGMLFRAGEPFTALYAIRLGSFKTKVLAEDGRAQITGFHMRGDILGLDGIGTEHHACEAVALEDTEVCALPFDRLEKLARTLPSLQHNLHRFLSCDIGRDQNMMLMLGRMRAEERLAGFLLSLSERFCRLGYSPTEFVLRMTREDIGSYLGMQFETVSRLLSRFHEEGLLMMQGRQVRLLDLSALKTLTCRNS